VTVVRGGVNAPGTAGRLTGGKSIAVTATSVVVTGLAGLVTLTGLAGCTSSLSSDAAKAKAEATASDDRDGAAETRSPSIRFSGNGTGSMEVIKALRSLYGEQVGASAGALYRLRAPGSNRDVFVVGDSGAFPKRAEGWKVAVVSTDAMWDPDRCSTLDPVDAGSSRIAMFEMGVQPVGDASTGANPSWYQLTVTDGKTFQRLTPTPAFSEIAIPKTLTALGHNRVGYLWSDGAGNAGVPSEALQVSGVGLAPVGIGGSLAPSSPGALAPSSPGTLSSPNAPAVPPGSVIGAVANATQSRTVAGMPNQLHWREVDLKSMTFADRLVHLPDGQVLRSAYRQGSRVVLENSMGAQYRFDPIADNAATAKLTPNGKSAGFSAISVALNTLPRTHDSTPTDAERKLLASVKGLSDVRVLSRSEESVLMQVAHIVGTQMIFDVASLNTKSNKVIFAPVDADARRCLVSRD
jgi:hypothetical protein